MLLLRSNGTLLHMKDCIITFVKLIISKKHNFILYNALTNRDSPNFPLPSNPLPQIVTSNPRLQTDTYFAVDIFHIRKPSFFRSLASNPNFRKSPEIRRFLALDFIFSTSILPSQREQSDKIDQRSRLFPAYILPPEMPEDLLPG